LIIAGVSFGQGVYFAVNSSLSVQYSMGSNKMFRVRVLVGDSCVGNSSMKVPLKNPNTGEPYDSTTDGANSLYVCYHDNQCYPEYLISYA
jgi:poly [ADP-ribose] polymerase 10/14/15